MAGQKMHARYWLASVAVALLASGVPSAWCSVIITGTRVIYPSDARDVKIKLTNTGEAPALVQAWLDDGDPAASPEKVKVPFVLTPPVSRIDQNKNQTLRLVYTGETQSFEKEALYWLNVLEIPPKPTGAENYLQFAVRTRIKVFYRPAQLKSGPAEVAPNIQWSLSKVGTSVVVRAVNPSPYYLSLAQLRLSGEDGKDVGVPTNAMIEPRGEQSITFEGVDLPLDSLSRVRYQVIDDYGAFIDMEKAVGRAGQ